MIDKMRVWECKECNKSIHACLASFNPNRCIGFTGMARQENFYFHETTHYEITECKPDYKTMAERGQIGSDEEGHMCRLVNYLTAMTTPFEVQYFGVKGTTLTPIFTPCAEPVELDPITMEKTK